MVRKLFLFSTFPEESRARGFEASIKGVTFKEGEEENMNANNLSNITADTTASTTDNQNMTSRNMSNTNTTS